MTDSVPFVQTGPVVEAEHRTLALSAQEAALLRELVQAKHTAADRLDVALTAITAGRSLITATITAMDLHSPSPSLTVTLPP